MKRKKQKAAVEAATEAPAGETPADEAAETASLESAWDEEGNVDGEVEAVADASSEPVAVSESTPDSEFDAAWDGPTRAGDDAEIAGLAAESARVDVGGEAEAVTAERGADAEEIAAEASAEGDEEGAPIVDSTRLESIIESLLFAADRALTVADLKRLVNERDAKKIGAALEALRERHATTGIILASVAGGWQLRTSTENAPWVSKLIAGRPQRLSRAMLETLAIVAYRQPVTRPEIDEIRGVDCGPVLKTLLDRELVRILGKKEEVGRPMLYGTTPEFLKTFSLKDLAELPTLREFHELSEQQKAVVDAQLPLPEGAAPPPADAHAQGRSPFAPQPADLTPVDSAEEEELLDELENATLAATRASGPPPGAEANAAAAPDGAES
ncbi:MAG TPA: SMC-Scp complex subunit ScpB [Polyangia bacterium]|nr:SMC-Scp complex subunit ScpB [Polyangia bacterium]